MVFTLLRLMNKYCIIQEKKKFNIALSLEKNFTALFIIYSNRVSGKKSNKLTTGCCYNRTADNDMA